MDEIVLPCLCQPVPFTQVVLLTAMQYPRNEKQEENRALYLNEAEPEEGDPAEDPVADEPKPKNNIYLIVQILQGGAMADELHNDQFVSKGL